MTGVQRGSTTEDREAATLIVGELLSFPGSLGSHPLGSSTEFETDAVDCQFADYKLTL